MAMHVHKPADAMLLLGYQSRAGRPLLTVTVGYCCGADGVRLSEQEAWAWLAPQFGKIPFDLSLKKSRGGYGVAGEACAPQGQPVTGLTVRAGVGGLHKAALVQGDRYWSRGLAGWKATPPQPFTRMPIGASHAYGGKEWTRNPVGRGHCADAEQAEGLALPNVERPDAPVLQPADQPMPALFGALPEGSPDQTRWLGRLDGRWQRERLPWLPDDTDPRWFDRFEQDQCRQQGYWRGDEPWFAEHMHPQRTTLRGTLPALRPRLLIRTDADPEQRLELPLDLDTVWLFPNDARVLVLYRGEVAVRREDAEDVLGLAVYTETMAEPPQPREHWAQAWRGSDEAALEPKPAPPAAEPSAAAAARISQAKAEAAKAAAAHKESVYKEISGAREAGIAEADKEARRYGLEPISQRLAKAPPPSTAAAPEPVWPKEPAAFSAAVHEHIAKALAAGEAEARAQLKSYGFDYDAAVARAAARPPVTLDPVQAISALNIDPVKKAVMLKQLEAWQAKMDAVQLKAAELSRQAEAMRAQAPPAPPSPGEATPRGPRAILDRESLLERQASGNTAGWCELTDLDLSGLDLSGLGLDSSILRRCNLRGANLAGADFTDCQLEDCEADGAQLGGARFVRAQLKNCQAEGAALPRADFSQARLEKTRFGRADMSASSWEAAQLKDCDLGGARLTRAQGHEARFTGCGFSAATADECQFSKAMFEKCVLEDAVLSGANLEGATLLTCRAAGMHLDGARLAGLRTLKGTDLQRARLDGSQAERACLQDTNLGRASLREARLDRGLLKNCDLSGTDAWHLVARSCDFTGSRIVQASWRGANLMKASLRQVVLQDVDLTGANMHAADTRTATAQGVELEQALLTRCRLLEDYASE